MRKFFLMTCALSLASALQVSAQSTESLTSKFSCKANYPKGKNIYLMDSCTVNFTMKKVVGKVGTHATAVWAARPDFTYNKVKVEKSTLAVENYGDLASRFDMITPKKAKFDVTLMFFSEKANCYFASATAQIEVPYLERAGESVTPPTFEVADWGDVLKNVCVGKQAKPGVVVPDASIKDFITLAKIEREGKTGKLDPSSRGYNFRIRNILSNASRVDVVDAKMTSVEWNESEYDFLVDEIARRKKSIDLYAKGDSVNADKAYYDNRKYPVTVGIKQKDFWNTTVLAYDSWYEYIEKADSYYKQQKWNEAGVYYKIAASYDSTMRYPLNQIQKISDYYSYKNNRNISGILDLVYVEGNGSVKSFYIGKTEITQRQWVRVMGTNPSSFNGCRDCPVENVSFEEVQQFLTKLNAQTDVKYRLPNEVEWVYAAQGGVNGSKSSFSGGENLEEVAWSAYNSEQSTHPAGSKAPNELGIYDMTGNVSEWISDYYDRTSRFVKGGSFADDASGCTLQSKELIKQDSKSKGIGFRVCQDE